MLFQLNRLVKVNWVVARTAIRLTLYYVRAKWDSANYDKYMRDGAIVLTMALEDLGATYVKLGQILAMRPDFLPFQYIEQLGRLLDKVRPFPTTIAINILEQDLGNSVNHHFRSFPDAPIASASFGQVYKAELHTGEVIAVKIRRPGVEQVVRADLHSMRLLAWLIDLSTTMMTVSMREFYSEFKAYTTQELDYLLESRHVQRIGRNAEGSSIERIPKVYSDLTTSRVLCLEFLEGIWVNEILVAIANRDEGRLENWRSQGLDVTLVSRRLIYILMKQVFVDGVFHADPHAANIVVMEGNVIGLVDFGIVGTLGGDYQKHMLQLMRKMGDESPSGAFIAILRVLAPGDGVNLRSFKRDYESNMQSWLDTSGDPTAPVSEKTAARLIIANLGLIRRYGLHLPPEVSRFYRALLTADSAAVQLNPQINMAKELRAIVSNLSLQRSLERLTPEHYLQAFLGYQNMLLEVPLMFAEFADGRGLETALHAVRSLDKGLNSIRRQFALLLASAMNTLALGLVALIPVAIYASRENSIIVRIGLNDISVRHPVAALAFTSVASLWISRRLRATVASHR